MTTVQRVAQIFGVIFLLVGILGFVSTGMSMDPNPETAPRLLGLFPVNALHNVVHLLFGVWGLVASRSFGAAKTYATVSGAIYVVLAVLGFIAPTTFGLIPIGGNDIWLHAMLGIALLAAGLTARETSRAAMA
ncbi:MAG TPA: DUF4383 domain-containing protein [Gemmatimonadaceae bacterium]|jgi:hypothetical protein|nr:DUF4383 domain-containing protein [Gemmatimonadaceae bacterium]